MRSSPAYAVMTDEDTADKKHLVFCVKYVDSDSAEVHETFLEMFRLMMGRLKLSLKKQS